MSTSLEPTSAAFPIPPLQIGAFALRSRLVTGTGKYRDATRNPPNKQHRHSSKLDIFIPDIRKA